MRYQPEAHGREPVPWLGIGIFVGAALLVEVGAFAAICMLHDTNLGW